MRNFEYPMNALPAICFSIAKDATIASSYFVLPGLGNYYYFVLPSLAIDKVELSRGT